MDDDADAWLFSTKIHALQLPQPVTPVQSGGVDGTGNRDKAIGCLKQALEYHRRNPHNPNDPYESVDICIRDAILAIEDRLDPSWLSELIDILGWQGGTIHDALSEVLTLVKFHENHHPTCKQSLQVDTAKVLVERLKWYIDELANCLGRTGRHCADMKDADEFLAPLATTQSAKGNDHE